MRPNVVGLHSFNFSDTDIINELKTWPVQQKNKTSQTCPRNSGKQNNRILKTYKDDVRFKSVSVLHLSAVKCYLKNLQTILEKHLLNLKKRQEQSRD